MATCNNCKGTISQEFIAQIQEAQRKSGRPPKPPKVCESCLWEALKNIPPDEGTS